MGGHTCLKRPWAGAVRPCWQGSPVAGEVPRCHQATALHRDREGTLSASHRCFPLPFPLWGGGGQGFLFHKSKELQDGNPDSSLQKPPSFRSPWIYPSKDAGDLQPQLHVTPQQEPCLRRLCW